MKEPVIILFLCMIFLSGCTRLEINYVMNSSGTIDISYTISVKQEDNNMINRSSNQMIDAAKTQATKNGFTVTDYSQNDYFGFTATKTIINAEYNKFDPYYLGFDVLPSIFTNLDFHYTSTLFDDSYKLALDIDLDNIIDMNVYNMLPSDILTGLDKLISQSEIIISFTMPGINIDTNAHNVTYLSSQDMTKYEWNHKPGYTGTMIIETSANKKQTRNLMMLGSVLGIFLCIVSISLVINKKSKNKYRGV